ncbi:MAG TPA: hypothetical protein VGQ83_14740 [Polyangia bacterium]|jgi:hypothetical protein
MRLDESPFYCLGLTPACSRIEVEREGQKLMAMLEVGMEEARRYPTPLGERERTVEQVRQAMADLRDPARRLPQELWALIPARPVPFGFRDEEAARQRRPAAGLRALLGWGPAVPGALVLVGPAPAAPTGGGAKGVGVAGGVGLGAGLLLAVLGLSVPIALVAAGAVGGGVWLATRRKPASPAAGTWLGPTPSAARALLQRQDPAREEIFGLETQINAQPRLDAEGILAAGLLEAARGDLDGARLLIGSLDDADEVATPPAALRGMAEYLMADALERGDLRAAAELARKHGERSPLLRFLGRAAVRLHGVFFGCAEDELREAWRRCPGADQLAPLFERARVAANVRFDDDEDRALEVVLPADPLGAALVLHGVCQRAPQPRLRRADLATLAAAWDRVFGDGEWRQILAARAATLGGGNPDEAAAQFRRAVTLEIAAMARASALPLREDRGETAKAAAYELRATLLNEFEPAAAALRARIDEQRALPPIDEWGAWIALRALALEAVRLTGQEGHRQVFGPLNGAGSHLSAWLYNARRQTYLSNLIDRGLLSQAFDVGSDDTVERLEKNVSLGA